MGIFGKKPGSDTDEESYRPNRDKEKSEKERMRELGQTQVSSPMQVSPGKATVPTMPPQRSLPAMPSVTTATAHEMASSPAAREATTAPRDTYTFPPRESLMYTPRESFTVPPRETGIESRPQEKKSMSYSIEDVIRLMRELPDSKKEMVVIIVQKTLLSAKIDITSILDDASTKTEKLQKQSDRMVTEIRDLEEAIILKKGEVDGINREIEEINGVKSLFEAVYSRHLREEAENKDKERQVTAPPVPGTGNAGGY